MKKTCSLVPSSMVHDCVQFFNKYGDEIVSFLEQGVQPGAICSLFHCSEKIDIIRSNRFNSTNYKIDIRKKYKRMMVLL